MRNMPKTTYLARVSVLSAEEEGRREFIWCLNGMEWNGMEWNWNGIIM